MEYAFLHGLVADAGLVDTFTTLPRAAGKPAPATPVGNAWLSGFEASEGLPGSAATAPLCKTSRKLALPLQRSDGRPSTLLRRGRI